MQGKIYGVRNINMDIIYLTKNRVDLELSYYEFWMIDEAVSEGKHYLDDEWPFSKITCNRVEIEELGDLINKFKNESTEKDTTKCSFSKKELLFLLEAHTLIIKEHHKNGNEMYPYETFGANQDEVLKLFGDLGNIYQLLLKEEENNEKENNIEE